MTEPAGIATTTTSTATGQFVQSPKLVISTIAVFMVIYRVFPETPGAGPAAMQSILLLPVSFYFGAPFAVDVFEIAILAAFGLLFAIASVTLAEGAKRVPASQTALLSALETPLAPILAFVILAELPAMMMIL